MKYEDMTHKELRHVIGKRDRAIVYLHERLADSQFYVADVEKKYNNLKRTVAVVSGINFMAMLFIIATHM